jgi:hypothetical protein
MKKSDFFGISRILAVSIATLSFFLTGCEQPEGVSGDAAASGITVAGVSVTLAAPSSHWWEAETGSVTINSLQGSGAEVVVTPVESGSSFRYAKVNNLEDDPEFAGISIFDLAHNDYVYVEIEASGGNILYYFFQVKFVENNFTLTKVTVGGVTANLGIPAVDPNQATTGTVGFNLTQAGGPVAIVVQKDDNAQTLRFAQVKGSGSPEFEVPDPLEYTFENDDFLYIEVTEKTGVFKSVYKIRVVVGSDIATITGLTIGTHNQTPLGTPNANYASFTTPASITNINLPTPPDGGVSVRVTATPTDAGATVRYNTSRTAPYEVPSFTSMTEFDFDYGSTWLDVEVTAPNGAKLYYRYRVNVGSNIATITALALGTVIPTLPTGGTPAVMSGSNANYGSATLHAIELTAALTNVNVVATPTDTGATIRYALASGPAVLPEFDGLGNTFSFPLTNTWIGLRVTSQNGLTVNYYRFQIRGSNVFTIEPDVTIGTETYTRGTANTTHYLAAAVAVNSDTPLTNVKVTATPTNDAAAVAYATTRADYDVPEFGTTDTFTFNATSSAPYYLYVRVTAVSGDVNFYRFLVRIGNNDTAITGIVIGNQSPTPGTPNATATSAAAVEVTFPAVQTNLTVSATKNALSTVRYAITTAANTAPVFGDVTSFSFPVGQTWLYVQVTAQSGNIMYYRFAIAVGSNDKTLTSVTVAGNTATLGTPAANVTIAAGNRGSVTVPALTAGQAVVAVANSSGAAVAWAVMSNTSNTIPTTFGTAATVTFSATNTNLVVRVTAENGTVQYYRIVAHL